MLVLSDIRFCYPRLFGLFIIAGVSLTKLFVLPPKALIANEFLFA